MTNTGSRLHWRPAYIGIGSNLESPEAQIDRAIAAIATLPGCKLVQQSSRYQSAPLGPADQPDYVNAAVAVVTTLSAQDLLAALQRIERAQGRVRKQEQWGPRTLDLDLLVFSADRIDEPGLSVPHPRIAERNFVLLPLAELAPHMLIPDLGTVAAVAARNDNSQPAIKKLH